MEQNDMTDGQRVMVIGTGGFAPLFKEHTDAIDLTLSELTLDGLRIIYDLNRDKADSD
jgi:pantothenate kinase type III